MVDYIINEKTIALKRKGVKTIIYNVDNVEVKSIRINKIIENSCNYYGSSLEGRKACAKNILNIKYKVPIIIEENKNLILLQLEDQRKKDCLFIMANMITSYEIMGDNLKINCLNNDYFLVNISKYSLEKMLLNSYKLNNILKWRKITNIV